MALADRDEKSEQEVADWEKEGDIVLTERNLESYLFADDVLKKLAKVAGKPDCADGVLKIKSDKLSASVERKNQPDDLKSAAGEIYVELKRVLELRRPGNNADAFMRDTLAPLITSDMETYRNLQAAIIDKINGVTP